MKNKLAIIFLFMTLFTTQAFGAKPTSKILDWVGSLLPNMTEVTWLVNIVNTYAKASEFLRTTKNLVDAMYEARASFKAMQSAAKDWTGDASELFNGISIYDMNSWATLTNRAYTLNNKRYDDIIHDLNMLQYYSLDIPLKSLGTYANLDTVCIICEGNDKNKKTKKNMSNYFTSSYMTDMNKFIPIYKDYIANTLTNMRSQEMVLKNACNSGDTISCRKLVQLQKKIVDLQSDAISSFSQEDTLIDAALAFIAENLDQVKQMENSIDNYWKELVSQKDMLDKMLDGNISKDLMDDVATLAKQVTTAIDSMGNYSPTDPNKVPVPQTGTAPNADPITKSNTSQVTTEDLVSIQSSIGLIELEQQLLLRDIEVIKARTYIFLTSLEAYTGRYCFDQVYPELINSTYYGMALK